MQYRIAETGDEGVTDDAGAVIATSNWISGRFADLGGRDYVLLGDAAGLADPATGVGIDYALRSAALAAGAFDEREGFATYPEAARRDFHAEMRRGLAVRRWLYRPVVADHLISRARHSPRTALVLASLADAINEHGSLRRALAHGLLASAPDGEAARAACDCAERGIGACAPRQRSNQAPDREEWTSAA